MGMVSSLLCVLERRCVALLFICIIGASLHSVQLGSMGADDLWYLDLDDIVREAPHYALLQAPLCFPFARFPTSVVFVALVPRCKRSCSHVAHLVIVRMLVLSGPVRYLMIAAEAREGEIVRDCALVLQAPGVNWTIHVCVFFLLASSFIPISYYVTRNIIFIISRFTAVFDLEMYDADQDEPCQVFLVL
jgi:hypothetical protein